MDDVGLPLKTKPFPWQCPYCRQDVGYLGNWLAKIFGTRFHGCDFSNVAQHLKQENAK